MESPNYKKKKTLYLENFSILYFFLSENQLDHGNNPE